jgi:hypothetical protein
MLVVHLFGVDCSGFLQDVDLVLVLFLLNDFYLFLVGEIMPFDGGSAVGLFRFPFEDEGVMDMVAVLVTLVRGGVFCLICHAFIAIDIGHVGVIARVIGIFVVFFVFIGFWGEIANLFGAVGSGWVPKGSVVADDRIFGFVVDNGLHYDG